MVIFPEDKDSLKSAGFKSSDPSSLLLVHDFKDLSADVLPAGCKFEQYKFEENMIGD